jgi:Na+-transporting methylmalonyl-CoA/oxaloacetate decarboxylase gamma subunit
MNSAICDISMNFRAVVDEGIVVAVVGYVTVFLALVVLYFAFTYLAKLYARQVRRKLARRGKQVDKRKEDIFIPGDVVAAISMAIYITHELHDKESNVITIRRVSKTYSPWSNRLDGLRSFRR